MARKVDFRTAFAAALLMAAPGMAFADAVGPNLVTNGDFEQVNMSSSTEMNTTNVTGWTTTGYNFIYFPGAATTGSYTPQYNSNVALWTPGNGSNNGFTATSPTGGNFVGADGAYEVAPISQTINNLHVGQSYAVSFYWAAAQQLGYTGATTEAWNVSFGNQTQATSVYQNASHGFSGWMQQTFTFTANATSQVLAFLAVGTPAGEPPFSLLDGVSVNAVSDVPEPAAWVLMALGLGTLFWIRKSRAAV